MELNCLFALRDQYLWSGDVLYRRVCHERLVNALKCLEAMLMKRKRQLRLTKSDRAENDTVTVMRARNFMDIREQTRIQNGMFNLKRMKYGFPVASHHDPYELKYRSLRELIPRNFKPDELDGLNSANPRKYPWIPKKPENWVYLTDSAVQDNRPVDDRDHRAAEDRTKEGIAWSCRAKNIGVYRNQDSRMKPEVWIGEGKLRCYELAKGIDPVLEAHKKRLVRSAGQEDSESDEEIYLSNDEANDVSEETDDDPPPKRAGTRPSKPRQAKTAAVAAVAAAAEEASQSGDIFATPAVPQPKKGGPKRTKPITQVPGAGARNLFGGSSQQAESSADARNRLGKKRSLEVMVSGSGDELSQQETPVAKSQRGPRSSSRRSATASESVPGTAASRSPVTYVRNKGMDPKPVPQVESDSEDDHLDQT